MARGSIPEDGPIVNRPDAKRIFEDWENSDFAKRLRLVFDNLHDEKLLEALEATRWTGRPGYPIKVMWRTYIASYVLNVGTFTGLIRELHGNPFLAYLCGTTSREGIPSKSRYLSAVHKHGNAEWTSDGSGTGIRIDRVVHFKKARMGGGRV